MIDSLLIGHNDSDFNKLITSLRSFGENSGEYKNRSLTFIDHEGKTMRALDLINYFVFGKDFSINPQSFFNNDFLQPAIAALGTYLHRHGNLKISYINSFNRQRRLLRNRLLSEEVLTVVITTTFYVTAAPIREIISFVRGLRKDSKIILGGPYISSQISENPNALQEIFEYLGADFYIDSAEGERTLLSLVKCLKTQSNIENVPNLYHKRDRNFQYTFKEIEKNELQENMVTWDLFTPDINEFASIRTSKSCPFSCSFCGFPTRLGEYVYYNLKFLQEELDKLKTMGVKTISYIDDTFNVPKNRFKEILKLKIERGYNFKWNSFFRCDFGDEETVELMKQSGCEGVFLGIESGSDTVLKLMNKSLRAAHVRKMVPLLREAGILTYASLIVGFPGETEETFNETMQLISEVKPDFFRVQLWYCDKSTPVWKNRETLGIVGDSFNWSHKTMNVQQAAALMENAFLTQHDSAWLPEDSFEFWSVFYLGRKGYANEQVKNFVEKFRVVIGKQKLLRTHYDEIEILSDIEELRQIILSYPQWKATRGTVNAAREFALASERVSDSETKTIQSQLFL